MTMTPDPARTVLRWLAMLLLAAVSSTAGAQATGGCRCSDARDLYSRYCASRAAASEWNRLISRVRSMEQRETRLIGAMEMKPDVEMCVDEVINIANQEGPGSRRVRGVTDRNCNVVIETAPNACMRGVIEHHESWHKTMCEASKRDDAPGRLTENPFSYLAGMINRMSQQSLIDYMYEERTGYMLESNYTRARLEELAGQCEEAKVWRPARQGRSFTLQSCPQPNQADYKRQCKLQ